MNVKKKKKKKKLVR